jgi:hypothetical protein
MSDYFERLEADLGALTREGAHLDVRRRWAAVRARRATAALLVALLLAVTLVSEFPSVASGRATPVVAAARG